MKERTKNLLNGKLLSGFPGLAAVMLSFGLVFAGCDIDGGGGGGGNNNNDNPGTDANGVDWTDYSTDYAFRISNLTSEKLVVFKSSIAVENIIGGLPAGADEHGIKNDPAKFGNKSSDFTLYFLTGEVYEENKDSASKLKALMNQPFTRIWAFYNAQGTNGQIYEISGKLGGGGKLQLTTASSKFNVELRLDSQTGETIGYAEKYSANTTFDLTPGSYTIFPVLKKYDAKHNQVITLKPTFSESHENVAMRGNPWFIQFNIEEGKTKILNAADFVDNSAVFTTGSAYLTIVNSSGNGVHLVKGNTLLSLETDFDTLEDADFATIAVDVARTGDVYNATTNVGTFKIGSTGYEQTLAGNLVDTNEAKLADTLLDLERDYVYQITVLRSGKFQWDGKQNEKPISLDDLEEDAE